jgi:protein SCO1/2
MLTRKKVTGVFFGVLAALIMSACDKAPSNANQQSGDRKTFEVKGVLKELKPNGRTAVIAHEEIPDYMPAMTMDLDVKDKRELEGLQPGDAISFRMVVTSDDGWIENVRKLTPGTTNAITITSTNATNAGPLTFRKAPVVEPLEVGQAVPDYKFTNHLGQPISFRQFEGQALGITFIFTRCPFPNFCPRMNSHFQQAQAKLKAMPDAPTNWMLLSISFDPEWDTPARMKKYAEPYRLETNHWQFATSDFWNIDGLTEQLGLQFWKDQATINHNLRTAVFDTKGRLRKIFAGNEWTPDEFVTEMVNAAKVK